MHVRSENETPVFSKLLMNSCHCKMIMEKKKQKNLLKFFVNIRN